MILELSPGDLAPGRSSLLVAYLEGVMLWPHDPEMRHRHLAMSREQLSVELARAANEESTAVHAAGLVALFEDAASAMPIQDLEDAAERPYRSGAIAGLILHDVLGCEQRDRMHASIELSMAHVVAMAKRRAIFVPPPTRKTIAADIWPKYKSVSHLFAAHLVLEALTRDPSYPFPCRPADIESLFGIAEAYRVAGEAFVPVRRTQPVLPAAAVYRLPDGLVVPKVTLNLAPLVRRS